MVQNLLSALNVLLGVIIVIYQVRAFRVCSPRMKWLYILKAGAGFSLALLFLDVLVRSLTGGVDAIVPILGRPVLALVESALVFDGAVSAKTKGEC